MQKFLDGKRTWIGLIVTVAGMTGMGKYIGGESLSQLLDLIFQVAGIVIATYGNFKAQNKIVDLRSEIGDK